MAMTSCRECGAQVSDEAETCPSCGIENPCPQKNVFSSIGSVIKGLFGWAVIIVVGLGIIGFLADVSQAECELVSRSLDADMFLIDGEPDAGFTYSAVVKNVGEAGEITVTAELSTSEGAFERKQRLNFAAQEEKRISFGFHEPTINAQNIEGTIRCSSFDD